MNTTAAMMMVPQEQIKSPPSPPHSPRSTTVAYAGKSLTPTGSPQGSRNSSFSLERDSPAYSRQESSKSCQLIETRVLEQQEQKQQKKKRKDEASPKKDTGMKRVTGIRGVHQMGHRYGKRFQVRVWLKRGQFKEAPAVDPITMLPVPEKERKPTGGKRIHLGCFSTLITATHAFDIAEIFFRGEKAATNLPRETYDNNPVLHFLFYNIKDRTCLQEFMTVWKHIMPFRWVVDAMEPVPGVVHQLGVIKEKLDKFRNKQFSVEGLQMEGGGGGNICGNAGVNGGGNRLSLFLQELVKEKHQKMANEQNWHRFGGAGGGGALAAQEMAALESPPVQMGHGRPLADFSGVQVANVVDARAFSPNPRNTAPSPSRGMSFSPMPRNRSIGSFYNTSDNAGHFDSTLYSQVNSALASGLNSDILPLYWS